MKRLRVTSIAVGIVAALGAALPTDASAQWRLLPRPPFASPADAEITGRLIRQIDPLIALFQPEGSSVPLETLGASLIESRARSQFFRLESLLRLYRRAFPDLEKYLAAVKEVEDGIGAYVYAVDSLSFARDKFNKENQTQPPGAARRSEQERILEGLDRTEQGARDVISKLRDGTATGEALVYR